MMMVRSYLAASSIEGLGVHAVEAIRKGQLVWRFEPEFDTSFFLEDVARTPRHFQEFIERYTYPHPTDRDRVVLDCDEGRFMNHSEDPSIDMSDPLRGIARRDIAAGEEITCDYRQFEVTPEGFQPSRHKVGMQYILAA